MIMQVSLNKSVCRMIVMSFYAIFAFYAGKCKKWTLHVQLDFCFFETVYSTITGYIRVIYGPDLVTVQQLSLYTSYIIHQMDVFCINYSVESLTVKHSWLRCRVTWAFVCLLIELNLTRVSLINVIDTVNACWPVKHAQILKALG